VGVLSFVRNDDAFRAPRRRNADCGSVEEWSNARYCVRRALEDGLIAAAGVLLILMLLVSADQRVRERVSDAIRPGNPSTEIANVTARVTRAASILVRAIKDQSLDQAPLVVFAAAGGGLFLAMLRL
jgi:hypothetical protein